MNADDSAAERSHNAPSSAQHATASESASVVSQEHTDVHVKGLLRFLGALVISLGIISTLVYFQYRSSLRTQGSGDFADAPFAAHRPPPPPPRLQTSPTTDLQAFRQRESERLSRWQWVDKEKRFARIPVDRAMDWIAANGRPSWPNEIAPDEFTDTARAVDEPDLDRQLDANDEDQRTSSAPPVTDESVTSPGEQPAVDSSETQAEPQP